MQAEAVSYEDCAQRAEGGRALRIALGIRLTCADRLQQATFHSVQGWQVPSKYSAVMDYLDRLMQRDSWKATYYAPEIVVAGWKAH